VQICCLVNVVLQNLALPIDSAWGSVRTPLAGCGARARVPAMRGLDLKADTTADTQGMALDPWGQRILIFGMYDSETMR